MRETIEFRIPEASAKEFLADADGICLGGSVRKIELNKDDSRFQQIGEADRILKSRGRAFFTAWLPHRRYQRNELASAEALRLVIKQWIEPVGEECGTEYDESTACSLCGGGATRKSALILDAKSLSKHGKLAIAKTIAGEVVVSESFVKVFNRNELSGATFKPVFRRGRPSEQLRGWYELVLTSPPVEIVAPTQAGVDPFDDDVKGEYRCPRGHVIGLALLSELWLAGNGLGEQDITSTRQLIGVRRGVLRPEPELIVSQRLRTALEDSELKGFRYEVVHFGDLGNEATVLGGTQ